MGLIGKIEKDLEIDLPAEKFYKLFKSECHHIPNACPTHIQGIDVHEGDWETEGSTKLWKYTIEGRTETFKEKVTHDDKNLTVTFTGIEGDLFKNFKSCNSIFKICPKGNKSVAKVMIEYEKLNDAVPDPTAYLEFLVETTKHVDTHLTKGIKENEKSCP